TMDAADDFVADASDDFVAVKIKMVGYKQTIKRRRRRRR
ncbi:hypothetical protein A2U01_0117041, partial [Trifolium medium]|nr:hypothetical protein [Trifolium medium]